MAVIAALLLFVVHLGHAQHLPCPDNEVKFALTQCDEDNGLWRVAVPVNSSSQCIPKGKEPLRITSCENVCEAGHFYNLEKLKCTECAAGTFSVGTSQIYDDWSVLPVGFATQSNPLVHGNHQASTRCTDPTWLPRGDFISLQEIENCIAKLTLDVEVVQETGGFVEFEYQFPDSSLLFVFNFVPAACSKGPTTSSDGAPGDAQKEDNRIFPERTVRGAWATRRINLMEGKQKLVWLGINMASSQGESYKPVRIRTVVVSGVQYSKSCTVCPAGTFSGAGAVRCDECPLNHISDKGSDTCRPCPDNQYALPGFTSCFDRRPCTEVDYVRLIGPCKNDTTEQSYEWITPKICIDVTAAVLPLPKTIPCPQCGRGMYRFNATACGACEGNQYVDSQGKCQNCNSGFSPVYKYELTKWDYLPSNMEITCWNSTAMGCAGQGPWQLTGNSITSGYGHEDDVVLLLQMFTQGFRKLNRDGVYGVATFDFEMTCQSPQCQMGFLIEDLDTYGTTTIETWTGTQARKTYQHKVKQNTTIALTWLFSKTNTTTTVTQTTKPRQFGRDVLRIFSINLTDTVDGAADSCEPCSGPDCLRCSTNEIWNADLKKCQPCPPNSIVSELDGTCMACGPNLVAVGSTCTSNCTVSLLNGKKQYDLTALKGFHQTSTQRFFEVSGEEYFHTYNISFCQEVPAVCANTVRRGLSSAKGTVAGAICRSTLLVSADQASVKTSVQSFVSARELTGVAEYIVHAVDQTTTNLFAEPKPEFSETLAPDFHYSYRSATPTTKCPSGRSTVITMRCSKNTTSMHDIRMPLSCTDGQCTGCLYRLLWLTPFACPICALDDYNIVRGECTDGHQSIYYHSPAHCHETNASTALTKQVPCSSVPFSVKLLLILLAVGGGALAILVMILYKNANKYKHRYMKLVQDASGVIHLQLPESCVDDHELDGNDEDDKDGQDQDVNVEFRTPSETVYAKVRKAVTRKKDLQQQRGANRIMGGFRESEENELLAE